MALSPSHIPHPWGMLHFLPSRSEWGSRKANPTSTLPAKAPQSHVQPSLCRFQVPFPESLLPCKHCLTTVFSATPSLSCLFLSCCCDGLGVAEISHSLQFPTPQPTQRPLQPSEGEIKLPPPPGVHLLCMSGSASFQGLKPPQPALSLVMS